MSELLSRFPFPLFKVANCDLEYVTYAKGIRRYQLTSKLMSPVFMLVFIPALAVAIHRHWGSDWRQEQLWAFLFTIHLFCVLTSVFAELGFTPLFISLFISLWAANSNPQTQNGEVAGSSGIAARVLGDFGNVNGDRPDVCGAISACRGRATKAGS